MNSATGRWKYILRHRCQVKMTLQFSLATVRERGESVDVGVGKVERVISAAHVSDHCAFEHGRFIIRCFLLGV